VAPALSIVLPCYNPPVGWSANIISQHKDLETTLDEEIEILLVVDGESSNISGTDIDSLKKSIPQFQLISYPENKGKGYATRQGVAAAKGPVIIYTDIDFPYTNQSIREIYTALKDGGADIAVGVKDERYYEQVAASRKLISKLLRRMIRAFLSIPVTDTQCGLKGFNARMKEVFLQTTINRYLFDLEFIRNSFKAKYRIKAIPVVLNEGVFIGRINYLVLVPEVINFIKLLFR
jgi:glycosyltransferase involved in cell wall biosynthesis